jgi:hypothetical protein
MRDNHDHMHDNHLNSREYKVDTRPIYGKVDTTNYACVHWVIVAVSPATAANIIAINERKKKKKRLFRPPRKL